MAKKKYVLNSFNGGISQDPYVQQTAGAVFDSYNIDFDEDLKSVRLASNIGLSQQIRGYPFDSYPISGSYDTILSAYSAYGYLSHILFGEYWQHPWSSVAGEYEYSKLLPYGPYNLILASTRIHYWNPLAGNSEFTGYLYGNQTTPALVAGNYTVPADWAFPGPDYGLTVGHTQGGGTGTLQPNPSIAPTAATAYRIRLTGNVASVGGGSCAIYLGNTLFGTINYANMSVTGEVSFYGVTTNTDNLKLIPTNDFKGGFNAIEVYQSNLVRGQWTFNGASQYKPRLKDVANNLLIGDGRYVSKLTWVSGATYSPVSGTLPIALTLASDEIVKHIFGLGSQIIIFTNKRMYRWDGVNSSVDRFVEFDETIVGAAQYKNVFYVTTSSTQFGFAVRKTTDGYDRQLIYRECNSYANNYYSRPRMVANLTNDYGNYCMNKGEYMFGGEVFSTSDGIVNVFGKKKAGYPEIFRKMSTEKGIVSLVKRSGYNTIIGVRSGTIGYVYSQQERSGLGWYGGPANAWLETTRIIGSDYNYEKTGQKVTLGYKMDYTTGNKPILGLMVNTDNNITNNVFSIADDSTTTVTLLPTVGMTFTTAGNTFTVTGVFEYTRFSTGGSQNRYIIINAIRTAGTNSCSLTGTLTKASGTGDATYTYNSFHPECKWIWGSTDTTKKRATILYNEKFNEMYFRVYFNGYGSSVASPILYSLIFNYDEIKDDTT